MNKFRTHNCSQLSEKEIREKKVAIATSNGSKAIIKSEGSEETILCSFLNINSVINFIDTYYIWLI